MTVGYGDPQSATTVRSMLSEPDPRRGLETKRKEDQWDAEGVAALLELQSKRLQKGSHLPMEKRSTVAAELLTGVIRTLLRHRIAAMVV